MTQVSVVVVAYDMARELPRVVRSLSPAMQRGIAAGDYEVIVVHNGSKGRAADDALRHDGLRLRILDVPDATVSPVPAVNLGLKHARGDLVGVMIDGARMASPGLVCNALRAARLHPRPVIASLGFHLGPDAQMRSIKKGYCQAEEDRLLESVDWEKDGYRLFRISSFAGSSRRGWFKPISESNALFLPRAMWTELGGYDERFVTPGGGLVNQDAYRRACALPDSQLIVLLGEGTFHQVHGGVATNSERPPLDLFAQEYRAIRGSDYAPPENTAWYFGQVGPDASQSIRKSWRGPAADN